MIILAIEASTSSAKALLYKEGEVLHVHQIPYGEEVGDMKRQDPQALIETVFRCGRELLQMSEETIDCIALSSVWSSLIVLDLDKKPITPLSTWADTTFSEKIKALNKDKRFSQQVYQKTGCNLHSKYPIWRFLGFKEEFMQNIEDVFVASLPEILYEAFTNDWAVSDLTASGSGFFNLYDKSWDLELLAYAGLRPTQLSLIVPRDTHQLICEEAKNRLGIKQDVMVFIPNGDGGLNHLYEMTYADPVISFSIGTSGAIRVHGRAPLLPKNQSLWSHYIGNELYVSGGAISGAGSCIQWFLKNEGRTHSLTILEEQLPLIDVQKAPLFLPFIFGEQSPSWQDVPRGGFVGAGEYSVVEKYYAILEGILFNIKQCYLAMLEEGAMSETVIVSGGITNSPYWLQLAADILGKALTVSSMEHASMMGEISVVLDYFSEKMPRSQLSTSYKPRENLLLESRYQTYLKHYTL